MKNRVIEWARKQVANWEKSIELMEKGYMSTGEIRDGKGIDTTNETIEDRKRRTAELKALISEHDKKTN